MCMKRSNWSNIMVECISCKNALLFVTDICGLNLEPRLTHQKSVLPDSKLSNRDLFTTAVAELRYTILETLEVR